MPVDNLKIRIDDRDVRALLKGLDRKDVETVMVRALNATARQTRSEAAKLISRSSGIRSKKVRGEFELRKARKGHAIAMMSVRQRATNVIEFVRGRTVPLRKPKVGVRANPWRKSRVFPGAFAVKGRNGNPVVLKRKDGGGRKELEAVYGPSVHNELKRDGNMNAVLAHAADRGGKNLAREADRLLAKRNNFQR